MADLEFRFTIDALPDGQAVTADELERLLLANLEESGGTSQQALWDLAILYSRTHRHAEAIACMSKLTDLVGDADDRAHCVLAMGQLHEQIGDFASAARFYRLALEVATPASSSWYWIHNNLGYSLNQLGQYEESERYLRAAIEIDPERANAFKNLGLALLGQNLDSQAAEYFVRATQANAADPRSLAHLEEVVAQNPALLLDPELRRKLEACRVAVHRAASAQPDFEAHWTKLRSKPSN
jgi:tetratricopeptide (TPR) repeat protein